MEGPSAYNFSLSCCRGKDNANADFLSRLPLPSTEEGISGSRTLSGPDDLGVYPIHACGLIPSSCPIPGIVLSGLIPQLDSPILDGLLLTNNDLRTHCAPFLPPHMDCPFDRPHMASAEIQRSPYAIRAHENDTRPPHILCT